jgi:hypothetical protein
MAAWKHTTCWSPRLIKDYRRYVQSEAPSLKGRLEDCADLSMLLIVDFAEIYGLPLTFYGNDAMVYKSSGSGVSLMFDRVPLSFVHIGSTPQWNSKEEYYLALKQKIGANALWRQNTERNPGGPEPGDLLLGRGHAGLIFAVYYCCQRHPRSFDRSIIVYPGPTIAKTQFNVLEYFRDDDGPNGPTKTGTRFDYLNHRGGGKEKAELIYYANAKDPDFDPYEFRIFTPSVFQD